MQWVGVVNSFRLKKNDITTISKLIMGLLNTCFFDALEPIIEIRKLPTFAFGFKPLKSMFLVIWSLLSKYGNCHIGDSSRIWILLY